METQAHWDRIYKTRRATEVSWYQPEARLSLELIERFAPDRGARIVDVGGGASTLVDGLLAAGYRQVTVLDLSSLALEEARRRLGSVPGAAEVTWRVADILTVDLPFAGYDLWHDRAVFHFLTREDDRRRYVEQVRRAVRPGGHAVVASFATDGPERCSGLEVMRYSEEELHGEFGADFRLLTSVREDHVTPQGAHQAFVYCLCRVDGLAREESS